MALADQRIALEGLRCHLAQIKSDLAWRRLRHALERKYSDSQPRVPAGETGGGQWTSGSGGSGRPRVIIRTSNPADDGTGDGGQLDEIVVDGLDAGSAFDGWFDGFDSGEASPRDRSVPVADREPSRSRPTRITDRRVVSDADPEVVRPGERYAASGHHKMPQASFNRWNLPPETRRIFDSDTTGRLPGRTTIRLSPDGVPVSHGWNKAHREYNKAVEQLSDDFLSRNDITPETMNPSQAKQLLEEIRNSSDPRISDFNRAMRMLRRVFQFRFGRSE